MADPIKQYVNLNYDASENHGSKVVYEVEADKISDEDNVRSEWWVEATGADNTDLKYLRRSRRARVRRTYVKNKKNKFKNTLYLPHVGGDRYKVKCSKKDDRSNPVEKDELETWRKLFYTVHYMNDDCKNMYTDLKTDFEKAYKDAFIELERAALIQTLRDEARTRSTLSLRHLYRRRPRLSNRPFHLRLVIINDLYERKNKIVDLKNQSAQSLQITLGNPMRDGVRRDLRYCKIRVGRSSWKNVKRYCTPNGDTKIDVDLRTYRWLTRRLARGRKYRLKIRYRARVHYLGHSIGNFCCVRIKEKGTAAQRKKTILQTLTHEVGHGCQQTVRRERLHDARGRRKGGRNKWEKNPTWYNDRWGGQGPHCKTNAKLEPNPPDRRTTGTRSGQEYQYDAASGGDLCTMYHKEEPHVDAKGEFCDVCKPRLKRVDLGRSNMRRKGWYSY